MVVSPVLKGSSTEGKQKPAANTPEVHTYKIKKMRVSESAQIFFAQHCDTKQKVVIKILREYEDTRYSLRDPQRRIACQIEALQWNQQFTPGIYLGLGYVVEQDGNSYKENAKEFSPSYISIKDIINDIEQLKKITDSEMEYALVMECLPKERRLDYLLRQKNTNSIYEMLDILVKRVGKMHKLAPHASDILPDDKGNGWGSYEQLKDKLFHNIDLFNNLESLKDRSFYEEYSWLKKDLKELIENAELQYHFGERLKQNWIRRCHGDLKTRNIWIESKEQSSDADHRVRILDAIDFNPSYCNIDVLSDIAMLAIDVQVTDMQLHENDMLSKRGHDLAQFIVKVYYKYMQSNKIDKTTQIVLAYYLLEKSLVRASISLFYDRDEYPQLGAYFLKITVDYMAQLKDLLHLPPSTPCTG